MKVRMDSSFIEHERWERLGAEAFALHASALSFVNRTFSDGYVSAARVRMLTPMVADPDATAAQLVSDGLWSADGDGFRVCAVQFDLRRSDGRGDEQPSKAHADNEREKTRQRLDKYRARKAGNAVTNDVGTNTSAVQCGAVQPLALPTAPCEHGRPDGHLLTSAGTARCPECRQAESETPLRTELPA